MKPYPFSLDGLPPRRLVWSKRVHQARACFFQVTVCDRARKSRRMGPARVAI